MRDRTYEHYDYRLSELEHGYGPNVHLLACPVLLTQLARLCRAETVQPEITWLVRDIYETMVRAVIANELPRTLASVDTRMIRSTPRAVWCGQVLDPTTRVITVDIARAGTMPSQIAFEALLRLLSPKNVRQDHLYMNRVTDLDGVVTGVSLSGSKIGGDVQDAIVLFPDPMGATGGSMSRAAQVYKHELKGTPRRVVTLNLIVTPEFIRRITADHPDMVLYAIRLDRGMSESRILETTLGAMPDESGLDAHQYIVPGAGGLGEILNNSEV